MKLFENFPIEFIYGFIAIAGGVARYLNQYTQNGKFHFGLFLASGFVSGFSGYMFALLGQSLNLPTEMLYIMAGVGGFTGEQTMKFLLEHITKKLT